MIDSDKRCLSIWKKVNFNNSPKNPTFFLMITINNHTLLQLIVIKIFSTVEMSAYEVVKVIDQFKGK